MKGIKLLLPPGAEAAWLQVGEALAGELPPCSADPEPFFGTAVEVASIVAVCARCPARQPCAAFGAALEAEHGVWGGEDRSRLPTSTKVTTSESDEGQALDVDAEDVA